MKKPTIKTRWVVVRKDNEEVVASEQYLYEALETARAHPNLKVAVEVEIRYLREPTELEVGCEGYSH